MLDGFVVQLPIDFKKRSRVCFNSHCNHLALSMRAAYAGLSFSVMIRAINTKVKKIVLNT